jgi:hypothetical protein
MNIDSTCPINLWDKSLSVSKTTEPIPCQPLCNLTLGAICVPFKGVFAYRQIPWAFSHFHINDIDPDFQ